MPLLRRAYIGHPHVSCAAGSASRGEMMRTTDGGTYGQRVHAALRSAIVANAHSRFG
jgi:hypothetical protein